MDLSYFVQENKANIVILTGFGFLILGVLTEASFYLSIFDAIIPMFSLSSGIIFLLFGIISKAGLFTEGLRSVGGLGTILLCVSIVLFALAAASFQFQVVAEARIAPNRFERNANYPTGIAHTPQLVITTTQPLISIFEFGTEIGLVLLIISMIMILYSHRR